ncbi:serine/threonine-protein kinase 11-interacting protein-like isoform X2 [Uloborus diversus]|uniref:serine/threonine-protein kinase 11-interacting protein-like isoform X2 n=1 Tax=Uloborus diversus TaxID=327109 RepID=UPI002409D5B1|nr:serine/threonine-protein kinase 11-interacting protein-like isoform X2 [Uloborus diversus]
MSTSSRYVLASKLAQFLRRNGEKVLNGTCKLSLTTSALCLLNSLFADVLNHDWYNTELSDCNVVDVVADVQFLFDFMKRTTNLKLFHGAQTLRGGVDLSYFSSLVALELRKIPAHLIIGLSSLSVQLRALICSRSIYLLKEILGSSVDEQNTTDVWTELRELNVSYNYLECLDSSLKSLPNLEILDLSHNNLRSTTGIEALENLSFVNLSYNQLEGLPIFHSLSCRCLVKLYVRNNNLNDLAGLECLFNLEELDAGYNLLSDYFSLIPVEKLKSLKMLNLEGNPLFFHKYHRSLIINYLHPNVKRKGFLLNGKILSVPMSMLVDPLDPSPDSSPRHQTSINTMVGEVPNMSHIPVLNHKALENMAEVSGKDDSDENSVSSCTSPKVAEVIHAEIKVSNKDRKKSKNSKRKNKLSKVSIVEPDNDYVEVKKSDDAELPSHVKAKHALEARRVERGQSWLIPDNPLQKSVLSFPKVPANTPVCNSIINHSMAKSALENELLQHFEAHVEEDTVAADKNDSTAIQEMTEVLEINANASDRVRHGSKESDDIEVLSTNANESCDLPNVQDSCDQDTYDCDIYRKNFNFDSDHDEQNLESESDEESEDSIFYVEAIADSKKEAHFINIGPRYAKEKDVISGRILEKIDLNSLKSIKTVTQNGIEVCELQLEFDTSKTSRQKRHYIFDNMESTQKMVNILQPYADAYTLKETSCGALECLNCNSQFSKQIARLKVLKTKRPYMDKELNSSSYDSSKGYYQEAYACPNCDSHILVEMEGMPMPSIAKASEKLTGIGVENASGGSASSGSLLAGLFTSINLSPLLKRKSSTTPGNLLSTGFSFLNSASNQSLDNGFSKKDKIEPSMSRNSSDVTLISNQSQNSFAVIPEPTNEQYLNTIVERDSQASLSPPVSSIIYTENNKLQESHTESRSESGSLNRIEQNGISSDDKDFISFTESTEKLTNNLQKSEENISSGSDVYLSPYKSLQSEPTKTEISEPMELDESLQLLHILGEKKTITYDMFKELDHRLKLYLEFSVLCKDEQFEACLQSSIVPLTTGEEFDGLFMLSSKSAYIIRFLAKYSSNLEQNEPLDKCVQIVQSSPLSHLRHIQVLLGNQGLIIAFVPESSAYTIIVRDADVCNSFRTFLADALLEYSCEIEGFQILTPSNKELELLNKSVISTVEPQSSEVLLYLFAFKQEQRKDIRLPVCIVVTHESIFLTKIIYKKQDFNGSLNDLSVYEYTDVNSQNISDLISLKVHQDFQTLEISFLDESSTTEKDTYRGWILKMQTKSSLFSLVSVLKGPWEEIFGISLPLNLECKK